MPKKKIEEVAEAPVEEAVEETTSAVLSDDFGRDDLNQMRDVVNELAAKVL